MSEWDKFIENETKRTERLKKERPCDKCKQNKTCKTTRCDDYQTWFAFQWDKVANPIREYIKKETIHRQAEVIRDEHLQGV